MRSRASAEDTSAVPLLELYHEDIHPPSTNGASQQRQEDVAAVSSDSAHLHSNVKPSQQANSRLNTALTVLLPSFVSHRYFKGSGTTSPTGRWHPTAFLDGLRGVACITVFHLHILNLLDKWHWDGWGVHDHDDKIIQLPLLRLVYSGNLAVHVFFVISGFALSVSVVKLMLAERRDVGALGKSLASSIFRRPIRLFFPAWASTVPAFFYFQLGIYAAVEPMRSSWVFDGWPRDHSPRDTFWLQIQDFVRENMRMLNIFELAPHNRYNGPTWTIPVEFRASLVLYLTHAALFTLQRKFRFAILLLAIFVALAFEQTDLPLFWAGFMLAEHFFFSKLQDAEVTTKKISASPAVTVLKIVLATAFFILSLWVGSFPEYRGRESAGYVWLATFKPPHTFESKDWWRIVGAIGIVGSIVFCPCPSETTSSSLLSRFTTAPKAFLSSPLCRYLGKISYGLYLSHYLVLDTFGIIVFYTIFSITGMKNPILYYLGFICSYVLVLAAVVWVGDIFWRLVDQPCVRLARWLEKKLSVSS